GVDQGVPDAELLGLALEVAPVVQAGKRDRNGGEHADRERVVRGRGADDVERGSRGPGAERHVGERGMERRPEPHAVEDVPHGPRDRLDRVLHRPRVHHLFVSAPLDRQTPGMRVALMIEGQEGVTWEQWCALADACEEHGVETLFRSDHYISQADESGNVAHDAWTTIAALAARTARLRFGTLVSPATFRAPALLANAAATADHVSGGRIELGLGAGWMEREHRAFGFAFPETPVRVEMFAEQLEVVHRLWTEDRVDFSGRHYTLENAPGLPKPVQRPRPPIIVGGSGGRGTVEPALRFADEYNTPFVSPEEAARIRAKVPSL